MTSGIWQAALASSTAVRIPLFSGERVSSRFLLLPFLFILITGICALQRFIREKQFSAAGNILFTLLLVPAVFELWKHLNTWKVTEAVKGFPYTYTDLSIKVVTNHPDRPYTTALLAGLIITLLTAVVLILRITPRKKIPAS